MQEWLPYLIPIAVLALFMLLKRRGMLPMDEARRLLDEEGARVIDVRSSAEFSSDHLACASNVPLDQLVEKLEQLKGVNKDTPLLLHCLSGGRSGLARMKLLHKGYTRVYNLGSIHRAKQLEG